MGCSASYILALLKQHQLKQEQSFCAFFLFFFFFGSTSAHSGGFLDCDLGGWLSHAALRTEKKNPFPFFSSLSLPWVGGMGPNHVPFVCPMWATLLVQLKHSETHQEHLYQPRQDKREFKTEEKTRQNLRRNPRWNPLWKTGQKTGQKTRQDGIQDGRQD